MKTIQQIKEEHAIELGYPDFEELFSECAHTGIDVFIDLIAEKYANEKVKHAVKIALQTAAERAEITISNGNTPDLISSRDKINLWNNTMKPNRELILSLEQVILEKLNVKS